MKIGGIFSSYFNTDIVIAQRSVLEPTLFSIFINSIFSLPFSSEVTAFADNMACTFSSNSLLNLTSEINNDLELLRQWFTLH